MNWERFEHGGRVHRFAVLRADGGVWVGWPGRARLFKRDGVGAAADARGTDEVRAPMTGKVVKVAACEGGAVRRGDVLVVVEAMKMEYRLAAPHDGTIAGLSCAEGGQVDLGQVLLTVRPA